MKTLENQLEENLAEIQALKNSNKILKRKIKLLVKLEKEINKNGINTVV